MDKHKRFEYSPPQVLITKGTQMKRLLLALITTLSFNAFSQSYFVLESGVTISIDTSGYVYDFGHYTPVGRVTVKGGQYLVEDTNVLVTVDERGGLFRKYEMLPKQVVGKGINYFIGDNGTFYGIDSQGFVNLVENNEKIKTATKFGGNYFTNDADEVFVVTSEGKFVQASSDGLKSSDIITYGGNYFMTNRGVLYTTTADGKVVSKRADRVGIIVKKGGNYFVDSTGMLYTVGFDGALKMPTLPLSLRIQAMSKLGSNYFMDGSGKLFTVDKEGNVFERWVTYDLKTTKIISL